VGRLSRGCCAVGTGTGTRTGSDGYLNETKQNLCLTLSSRRWMSQNIIPSPFTSTPLHLLFMPFTNFSSSYLFLLLRCMNIGLGFLAKKWAAVDLFKTTRTVVISKLEN
jgi:hypothetical protein